MIRPSDRTLPNYRWNFVAFLVDYVFFAVAISFVRPDSVLPAFVRQLTGSAPVIGLVSTIWNGCWLLPQVFTARWINDKPRKKPYLMVGATGRVCFLIVGLSLWFGLVETSGGVLALFFICLALFALTDGLASVAWFDILARVIPVKRRGRLMGTAQIVSGVGGLGVGWVIGRILASGHLVFPRNYALILTLAGVAFIPSVLGLSLLREAPRDLPKERTGALRPNGWLTPLLEDASFRRLMVCRVLVGMISLVTPFYVLHATDVLGLSPAIVGSFVAAQQVAGVASGALLGLVSDRWGPCHTIRIGTAFSVMGPLFALLAHTADGGLLVGAYPLVYVALGVFQSSTMLGFYNYLLEIAPDDVRPSYIGLGNTVMGVLTLAPTVGGWLLEVTSFPVLFAVAASLSTLGFVFALRLRPAPPVIAGKMVTEESHA